MNIERSILSEILAKLRQSLANLYGDEASIRRVITDVGIDPAYIQFNTSAINIWSSVLTEAQKTERLVALLDVVETEYGTNADLHEVSRRCRSLLAAQSRSRAAAAAQNTSLRRRFSSDTLLDEDQPQPVAEQDLAKLGPSSSPADDSLVRFTAIYRHDGINSDEVRSIYDNGQHVGDCGLVISSNNRSASTQPLGADQVVVLEVWLAEFANRKSTRRPHILLTVDEETKKRVYAQNPTTKRVKVRVAKAGLSETVEGQRLVLACVIKQVSLLPASRPNPTLITFEAVEVELSVWDNKTKHPF